MNRSTAWNIAMEAHEGQADKCGRPYDIHCYGVAAKVRPLGEDFEVVAFLHDVAEDTDYPIWDKDLSGPQEKALIAITRTPGELYRDYIQRVKGNFIARVVKIADLQHNLIPERLEELLPSEAESLSKRYTNSLSVLMTDNSDVPAYC